MDEHIDKKKFDVGWIKAFLVVIAFFGQGYYWQGKIDSHTNNPEIHRTQAELANMFVLRREYDSNVTALREDIRWLKNEIIRISDKLDRLAERGNK